MPEDQTVTTGDSPKGSPLSQWAARQATRKVGLGTIVVFIGLLGVFCLLASGIGYLTHHLRVR